jgi:nitrous oxidase accessory protein
MTDYAGIKVYKSEQVIVRNNILLDMFFGIYFQECKKCFALNNTLKSFRRG